MDSSVDSSVYSLGLLLLWVLWPPPGFTLSYVGGQVHFHVAIILADMLRTKMSIVDVVAISILVRSMFPQKAIVKFDGFKV